MKEDRKDGRTEGRKEGRKEGRTEGRNICRWYYYERITNKLKERIFSQV